ncbi:MAG: hypothetical protein AABY22_00085 [Nanoarchaeota archaeon]
MTERAILKKAVEKATNNGFSSWFNPNYHWTKRNLETNQYFSVIFSHDFAEAFWPGYIHEGCYLEVKKEDFANHVCQYFQGRYILAYGYHLQQMVLEKNPILYLKRFI